MKSREIAPGQRHTSVATLEMDFTALEKEKMTRGARWAPHITIASSKKSLWGFLVLLRRRSQELFGG